MRDKFKSIDELIAYIKSAPVDEVRVLLESYGFEFEEG